MVNSCKGQLKSWFTRSKFENLQRIKIHRRYILQSKVTFTAGIGDVVKSTVVVWPFYNKCEAVS